MADRKIIGTLYGVGVGPGDPDMVTLGAIKVIQRVPLIAFPVNRPGARSRAYEAVKGQIPEKATLLPLLMPMTRDPQILSDAHEQAADTLARAAAGGDVAYLSLGDPLFYSTFSYLAERFPGSVEVVGGITAVSACTAALGVPLAAGDTPTVIVTGQDEVALETALGMSASIVIMKPKSLSESSLDLLENSGALERAVGAVELGAEGQRLMPRITRGELEGFPYFSIVIIRPVSNGLKSRKD